MYVVPAVVAVATYRVNFFAAAVLSQAPFPAVPEELSLKIEPPLGRVMAVAESVLTGVAPASPVMVTTEVVVKTTLGTIVTVIVLVAPARGVLWPMFPMIATVYRAFAPFANPSRGALGFVIATGVIRAAAAESVASMLIVGPGLCAAGFVT